MQPHLKDHYSVLGVPRTATDKEIKLAFRKKAKAYHPDTSKMWDAEDMFKSLNKAYSILKDPKKRAAYNVELMGEIFQQTIVDPAQKRASGFGYTSDVEDDEYGLRVG